MKKIAFCSTLAILSLLLQPCSSFGEGDSKKISDLKSQLEASPEIQRLEQEMRKAEQQIQKQMEEDLKRPRVRYLNYRMETRFGVYIEDCLLRVLRYSTKHEYKEAKGHYGKTKLSFDIYANGTVDNISIVKSSGDVILDKVFKQLIVDSAPFLMFPDNIKKDTDILFLVRTFERLNPNDPSSPITSIWIPTDWIPTD